MLETDAVGTDWQRSNEQSPFGVKKSQVPRNPTMGGMIKK
jgi:hypothetical protein